MEASTEVVEACRGNKEASMEVKSSMDEVEYSTQVVVDSMISAE